MHATVRADGIPEISHRDCWDLPELAPEDRAYIRSYEWGAPRQQYSNTARTLQNTK